MAVPARIAVVAGERSGDALGAALIRRVHALDPTIRFEGVAGPCMQAAGCRALADTAELSVMGLVEVLGQVPRLMRLRRGLLRHFLAHPPQLFLGIDAPDFNLALARRLKRAGIPAWHWVSPSVWAWRRYRLRGIARSLDHMLTLFPFEAGFYREHGLAADYVGHPLADAIPLQAAKAPARQALGIAPSRPCVALLPGSRRSEVDRLLPVFLASAVACRRVMPDVQFVLPVADPALRARCEAYLRQPAYRALEVRLLDGQAQQAMAAADVVLLASGTATLECMLLKRPMVVAYRLHPLSYALVSRMLQVPWVSLPNTLLQRAQVPEFLQHEACPARLAEAVLELLRDPAAGARQVEPFAALHETLRLDAAGQVAGRLLSAIRREPFTDKAG